MFLAVFVFIKTLRHYLSDMIGLVIHLDQTVLYVVLFFLCHPLLRMLSRPWVLGIVAGIDAVLLGPRPLGLRPRPDRRLALLPVDGLRRRHPLPDRLRQLPTAHGLHRARRRGAAAAHAPLRAAPRHPERRQGLLRSPGGGARRPAPRRTEGGAGPAREALAARTSPRAAPCRSRRPSPWPRASSSACSSPWCGATTSSTSAVERAPCCGDSQESPQRPLAPAM